MPVKDPCLRLSPASFACARRTIPSSDGKTNMHGDLPLSRDLMLIGGGHAHALVLKMWGMRPLAGARLTLVTPTPSAPYTGMLPGFIAGHYGRDALEIDLVRLARFAGARLVLDEAIGIDRERRLVELKGRPPIRYDTASINVGVTSELSSVPGFDAFAVAAKPMGRFAAAWEAFVATADAREASDCIVIGGGVAGVELALAMACRLRSAGAGRARVRILEAGPGLLAAASGGARRALMRELAAFGIEAVCSARLASIRQGSVQLEDGRVLEAAFVVSAAGARPQAWLARAGLSLTGGYVDVDPYLRTVSDTRIFAAGDCAHLLHAPRPKAGVFTVRSAPVLLHNLRASLMEAGKLRRFNPQADYLKLISAGRPSAIAEKFGMSASGPWAWRLKQDIDLAFMKRLTDLPQMSAPDLPAERAAVDAGAETEEPLCGGCGAKVSREGLEAGLAATAQPSRADTVKGPGDDAGVLRIGGVLQVISADHLRAFWPDPYVSARIAAVHALGDVWAMGAGPQSALVSLILPRMSERMQSDTVAEIMSAIGEVLKEAGADLVGGHTSLGAEMTIGLTVTGLAGDRIIGLSGARPGDDLILTKPIGSGVILAAEMRAMAKGRDVEAALASMMRTNAAASRLLSPVAGAMTDVTGFGLAGHLMSLLNASGVSARLDPERVPVLAGAEALAAAGVRSSIWKANRRSARVHGLPGTARADLLFDPQTAGGLLAAVPASESARLLAALAAAGETASVIGRIEDGDPEIRLREA